MIPRSGGRILDSDARAGEAKQRPVVSALSFSTMAVFGDLYITQPILPDLSREFHVSAPTAGLTISLLVLMIALISAAYGFLSDILGRKPVMVASCALLVI